MDQICHKEQTHTQIWSIKDNHTHIMKAGERDTRHRFRWFDLATLDLRPPPEMGRVKIPFRNGSTWAVTLQLLFSTEHERLLYNQSMSNCSTIRAWALTTCEILTCSPNRAWDNALKPRAWATDSEMKRNTEIQNNRNEELKLPWMGKQNSQIHKMDLSNQTYCLRI